MPLHGSQLPYYLLSDSLQSLSPGALNTRARGGDRRVPRALPRLHVSLWSTYHCSALEDTIVSTVHWAELPAGMWDTSGEGRVHLTLSPRCTVKNVSFTCHMQQAPLLELAARA